MDVSEIARAVLYEGYLLWPYRRSALKNRQRWTIGSLAPVGCDPAFASAASAQVLLDSEAFGDVVVTARFLQFVERQVVLDGEPVDELRVAGKLYQSWEEATEREITFRFAVGAEEAREIPFAVPAGGCEEVVHDASPVVIRRSWRRLTGIIHIGAEKPLPGVHRLTVRICNTTPHTGSSDMQARCLASAHIVLTGSGGFVSMTDPPERLRSTVDDCVSDGLFPVLAGEPGSTSTVLAAPIALYDWPEVAPESPGDLFDATEIDQMLVLNVLSLTSEEQEEMAASDPRAREILDRCAQLSADDLWRLHGTIRDVAKGVW